MGYTMANEDEPNPGTESAEYQRQRPVWDKIQTLLGGTEAMRAAGSRFLPRHEHERQQGYADRRDSTTLLNMTALTLDTWTGYPFACPVTIADVSPEMETFLEDVDLQGNDVTVFSREVFYTGLAKRIAYVLVDYPSTEGILTLDDQREAALRPYWCAIQPENLIAIYYDTIGGKKVCTHARIRESEIVRDGQFGEQCLHRVRVFDRVVSKEQKVQILVSIYRWVQDANGKGKWVLEANPFPLGIDKIPIESFEVDCSRPPIEDVADLNIEHWQSKSEQRSVLTVARFPILAASGVTDSEAQVDLGPKKLLVNADPQGRFYYVEHGGAAIAAGRQDLLDLEDRMAAYGAQFLVKKPGAQTATASAIDSAESTSRLQDTVVRFNDFLTRLCWLTAKWMGQKEFTGDVSVGTDFGPSLDSAGLNAITEARKGRDLSREAYLTSLQEYGVLSKDFDFDKNERELESENSAFSGAPVGGMPINDLGESDEKPVQNPVPGSGSVGGVGVYS